MTDFSLNMNNVVICQINSKYIHSSLASWCLLAGIREYTKSGVNASVIEGTVNQNADEIVERIIKQKPICVGFCTYIWNLKTVEYVAKQVKRELPECAIVLGGPQVSYTQRDTLERLAYVDYISSGEGEYPFAVLVDHILGGRRKLDGLGISYRKGGKLIISEPYLPSDIPPSPYTDEYFEQLSGRIAYLETSRGCPFSCAFCLSGRCGKLRYYPEERAKSELLRLAASGTKTVKLVDRTFNADRRRADRIWQFIADNYGKAIPDTVRFHFEISARLVDEKSLEVIKGLPKGAVQLEIGIQSFNPKTLDAISRENAADEVENITRKLISFGNVHIHTDIIAGLPFEDYAAFREGFDRSYDMKPHMLQLGFLKVLPGSAMGEHDYKYKCESSLEPPFEVISTEYISKEELDKLRVIEEFLERMYNSGRFLNTLEYVLAATRLSPFDLFEKLSESFEIPRGMRLDDFTQALLKALEGFAGVDTDRLFDAVLLDRMSTNPDGRLPAFLKHDPAKNSLFKKQLLRDVPELFNSGVRHCFAVMRSENCGLYARYDLPCDPITGRYECYKVNINLYEM